MARPTIDRLLDHSVRIWRATVDQDKYGVETKEYELVATVSAALNRGVVPVAPSEGGLAPTGSIRMYLRPDADVQARDVIEVISGPDATARSQRTYEVDQPPMRPKEHHTQLDCIAFNGTLPTVEES